jgi:hypothetical protein
MGLWMGLDGWMGFSSLGDDHKVTIDAAAARQRLHIVTSWPNEFVVVSG